MPFAKRGDVVHSEATSGFNNQKKSLLINGLAALGDSLHPLHIEFRQVVDPQAKRPTPRGWPFCCLVDVWSEVGTALARTIKLTPTDRPST